MNNAITVSNETISDEISPTFTPSAIRISENSEIWATVNPGMNPMCLEYPNLPIKKITISGFPINTKHENTIAGHIIELTAPKAI